MAFLQSLKSQTAERHAALENQMDIVHHFKSRESYVKLLERFFSLYEPLEQRLAKAVDWSAEGWDFESRRKTPWLLADMTELGLTSLDITALPRSTDLPEISSVAAAVGSLYVLEGSTLGGQVISRLLVKNLEIQPEGGGRFFAGYQEDTGTRWREFGAWAEGWHQRHVTDENTAVESARQTFNSFNRWFQ
jgi:heme oxygenase (biliverdin-IX-beta and delta-forming)